MSSTDRAWRKYGEEDPYFGVLTQPQYRRNALDDQGLRTFFASGVDHVREVLTVAERLCGRTHFRTALDFGCGVGRLTLPLASHADRVVGVDVSPAMIAEAEANCRRQGVVNAEFVESDAWLSGPATTYDLVHTFIVLQHIAPRRGMNIVRTLVERVAPGGVGVIHLTYEKDSALRRWSGRIRKHVPLLHNVINVVRGRPFGTPLMEMNSYDLNRVAKLLQTSGVGAFHAGFTDHGGHLGATMCFAKPAATAVQAQAA